MNKVKFKHNKLPLPILISLKNILEDYKWYVNKFRKDQLSIYKGANISEIEVVERWVEDRINEQ